MEKINKENIEKNIVCMLKSIKDIELPLNIYELGLIYKIKVDIKEDFSVCVEIITTQIESRAESKYHFIDKIKTAIYSIEEIDNCIVSLVDSPKWDSSMISPRALEKLNYAS